MTYTLEDLKKAFIDLYEVDLTCQAKKVKTEIANLYFVYTHYARKIIVIDQPLPFKAVGDFVDKDHSTASFYIRRFKELIEFDNTIQTIHKRIGEYLGVFEPEERGQTIEQFLKEKYPVVLEEFITLKKLCSYHDKRKTKGNR